MSKTSSPSAAGSSGVGCLSLLYVFIQAPLIILKVVGMGELTWLETLMPTIGYAWLTIASVVAIATGYFFYLILEGLLGGFAGVVGALVSGLWIFTQSGTIVLNWVGLWRESWGYSVYLPSRIGLVGAGVVLLALLVAVLVSLATIAIENRGKE